MTDLRRVQDALVEVHRADGEDALALIADVIAGAIEGCRWASVVLVDQGRPTTLARNGDEARALDEAQARAGDGPSLAAVETGQVCLVADVDGAPWPAIAEAARAAGIGSILAAPFGGEGGPAGAVTLYGYRRSFGPDVVPLAQVVAAHTGAAVANRLRLDRAEGMVADLRTALVSRDVIGQAKGILMASRRVTDDEAFALLRHASQRANVKLRVVAEEVARTGELPGVGEGQPTA